MEQTPIHDKHNPDLLKIIPQSAKNIIEVGCSSGALAREFKKISPSSNWFGVELNPEYAAMAQRFCDGTQVADIEECGPEFFHAHNHRDCWVFGDTLEHMKDPWSVLANIRKVIPENGSIAACIPNAQHWSIILRLTTGNFKYEPSGLLDKTHLRWFTRKTMINLFQSQGFKIVAGMPRIFEDATQNKFIPLLAELAKLTGANDKQTAKDLLPLQYVIRAIPV